MVAEQRTILLQIPTCPYCVRARSELDKAGISYETLDIDPSDRSMVQALSGQPSVPILVEVTGCNEQDDDIVNWIANKKSNE